MNGHSHAVPRVAGIADEQPQSPFRSLTQLLDHRAAHRRDQAAIYTLDESDTLQSLTYGDLKTAIDRVAWHYHDLRLPDTADADSGETSKDATDATSQTSPPNSTVGIFYKSSLNLTITEFALHRLGQGALLISPNNPASAVAGLLKATNTRVLLAGEKLYTIALEAIKLLADQDFLVRVYPEQVFPLFGPHGAAATHVPPYQLRFAYDDEWTRTCITLHSSGSTGHPKPLPGTHKSVLANGAANYGFAAATVLPLFHGFGHHASLRCIAAAKPLFVYPPHLPTTASNITQFLETCRAASPGPIQQLYAVAYILKMLSESDQAIKSIAQFDLVAFAGSALPDETGDRLTAANVKLISVYGTTETGSVMSSTRPFETDRGWNWLRVSEKAKPYVTMEERGPGVFECVVKNGLQSLAITNREDGFATRDLFLQNAAHPDQWKYCGRADDTITQTLGEKTNPVPMELDIRGSSEYITEAIVFGDGRPQTGCLVLPSDACRGKSPEEIRKLVMPSVEFANKSAPTHSRITPELVHILPLGTEVPLATKGSILRPACYAKFKDLIDSIYDSYNDTAMANDKLVLGQPELEQHVLEAIRQVTGGKDTQSIKPETDLFNFGIDSLQSARIRLLLARSIDTNGQELSQNVVYENPSVRKLASHLLQLRVGSAKRTAEEEAEQAHLTMWNLVNKYSKSLVIHHADPSACSGGSKQQVVVLTGATGALGAHILAKLVSSDSVVRVYALVRAQDDSKATGRVLDSIKQRRIDHLGEKQLSKIISLAANIDEADLGLTADLYSEIRNTATAVVANAWSVNFNLSVESFEADNIRGAYNLLNLCLSSPRARPACFYFSSSVSTRQGKWHQTAEEVITDDPSYAVKTGYGRSKWITEKMCEVASQTRGIHCGVLRIGQMCGDTLHGIWNTTEAIPLMFRTAQVIKALPDLNDHPSYLPVDISAAGIAEIVLAGDQGHTCRLYHIVNPNTKISFNEIYDYMERTGYTGFERVEPREWVQRLESSSPDPSTNPSFKLLDFFRNRFGGNVLRPQMDFQVKETSKVAPSIAECPAISADLVKRWVQSWREVGFFA